MGITRRRRTLLQLAIGGMLALIVVRRAMYWLESDLNAAAKPANRAALSVITGQVLHGFFDVTMWFLIGGLIVLAVALLAGPSRWAVATRAWAAAAGSAGQLVSAAGGHASSDATVTWVRRHLDLLRIGGAVIAALALLIFSVNWVTLLSSSPSSSRSMSSDCTGCARHSPPHSLALPPTPGRN